MNSIVHFNKAGCILLLSLHFSISGLHAQNNDTSSKAAIRDSCAGTLTLLRNENDILPLLNLDRIKTAVVAVGRNKTTVFQYRISKYMLSDNYFIDPEAVNSTDDLISKLSEYDIVIAGIYGVTDSKVSKYATMSGITDILDRLIENRKTVVTWFGNPEAMGKVASLRDAEALLLTYDENEFTEDLSAQLIFGGIGAMGFLHDTINEIWPAGYGLTSPGNIRMSYGYPGNAGMSSVILESRIDSIVNAGLAAGAFPGCEVTIARKGIVVFSRTYGYHNYDGRIDVQEDDLYDLASVTKVSSTLAGLMQLDSEGRFSPDRTLGHYLPFYKNSNKEDLLMSDILTHQAGLVSWIPFWMETVKKNGEFRKRVFKFGYKPSEKYPLEVARWMFINENYRKKIFNEIKKSPLGEKKYLYSDLAFIISPEIIESVTGEKWHEYVTRKVYHKIGAFDICFNPWMSYPLSRVVPTEYDSLFRKQHLHATVHDEGAAMLGGISGHAGLFATANDLMKLVELYRRMGSYGGEEIIKSEVLKRYTKVQHPENDNRRGLGFDKPLLSNSEVPDDEAYPTKGASPESFGHSGYTGTFVWVDPVYEISYVFLSNRVNPTRNNNLISELNIRGSILQAVYDSILRE